jgi:Rho-binding antiterminator
MDAYMLVSCDFHHELESLATLRQECRIVYRNADDEVIKVEGY